MKKFAILAGLMSLALVIGVAGTSFHPGKAEAKPTDVIAINPDVCLSIISQLDPGTGGNCLHLDSAVENVDGLTPLGVVADVLQGSVGDPDTYKDLVDASAAQLGADATDPTGPRFNSQSMWVLTFVTNDDNLTEDADQGVWLSSGASTADCAADIADEDCNEDGIKGDGVVVDLLYSGVNDGTNTLDLGDAEAVISDTTDVTLDYTVVGSPDDFALVALETTIQGFSEGDCELPNYHDDAAFTAIVGQPDVTGVLGTVVDEDGTKLTGIWVGWFTTDGDVADLAINLDGDTYEHTATIAKGTVVAAPNLACGDEAGDVTIHAGVIASPVTVITSDIVDDVLDPDDEVDLTVIGAPSTVTLAPSPTQITCDGVNTSEVSATVLNSAGKPVAAGNKVRFDVVALGAANPIVAATDANGVAKTTVKPLSGVTAGVTVLATVFEQTVILNDDLELVRTETFATEIEANALVSCAPAVPPTVAPPAGGGVVTPPRTGDGGYLP